MRRKITGDTGERKWVGGIMAGTGSDGKLSMGVPALVSGSETSNA